MSEDSPQPEQETAREASERRWLREATSTGLQAFDWSAKPSDKRNDYRASREELRRRRLDARMACIINRTAVVVLGLAVIELAVSLGFIVGHELDRRLWPAQSAPSGSPGQVLRD